MRPGYHGSTTEFRDHGVRVRERLDLLVAAGGEETFSAHGDNLVNQEVIVHCDDPAVNEYSVGCFLRGEHPMAEMLETITEIKPQIALI